MCKVYYNAFPCGHAVKLHVENCYPNFTCKQPEREDVIPATTLRCTQCGKTPAPEAEMDQAQVSHGSALQAQDLTTTSSVSDIDRRELIEPPTPSKSKNVTALAEKVSQDVAEVDWEVMRLLELIEKCVGKDGGHDAGVKKG